MSYDVTQSFSKNNLLSYIPLSEWILTLDYGFFLREYIF